MGLATVDDPCFLCGSAGADPLWTTCDRALGVAGIYTVVRCRECGFLYQRPRVSDEKLAECYPDHYPRHQEPSPRVPFKGSRRRISAARFALSAGLGYRGFVDGRVSFITRLRGRLLLRRLRWDCPPWVGQGRYLDVGCGSGAALGVARALGWQVAGIEMDRAAAEKARQFTNEIYVGDVLAAPFAPGRFDVVTALHVLEHVPDPVRLVRRMVEWLAPGGLLIIEVPNAAGLGARLFQEAWVGLELPRHLSHFSPETLHRVIERAEGHVLWCWQRAKPRHYVWSLRNWLEDHGLSRLAHFTQRRFVYGALKLFLEVTLPIVSRLGLGEVIRIGVAANSCRRERMGLGGPRSGMP